MSNYLLIEKQKRFTTVVFNRSEMRNPLSVEVINRLLEVIIDAKDLDPSRKLIFTGREGVFAAGANLNEIANVNGENSREFAQLGQTMTNGIAALKCLTIAAIDGHCYGGALDLALACKRRIASPRSTFAHPGAKLGIMTGWGGTQRLPRLIGEGLALEMFFTAEPINASRAFEISLIDDIDQDPLRAAISF